MMHEDRARALTLTGVNLVIEAGAGTGKTTLLIDRLCLCVLVQHIPVEKLVALTFTDKAAAEIKTRFIFKLQQLIQLIQQEQVSPIDPQVYATSKQYRTLRFLREQFRLSNTDLLERAQTALSRLDRAAIGTIHSFCAEILKMFPLEAGISPNAQIDTGQKATQLFEEHWNAFLDRELGINAPREEQWKQVLQMLSLTDLKVFAEQLATIKPVDYDYYSHRDFLADICHQKSLETQQLATAHIPVGKNPRAIEKALLWASHSFQRTQAFLKGVEVPSPSEEPCPSVSSNISKGWDEADFEQARGWVNFAQKITPENQQLFLAAYDLVFPLAEQVRLLYEEKGVLGFDDLIIKTRNLLLNNLYVRRVLKEKFDVLFVDEFQDTDPIQGELLLFLAEEKPQAASHWQDVHLQPGKLIVVGDPKQSIYRFRGADITAYELFTDLILKQGGQKCFLQGNYRSEADIIALANRVCEKAMVQETAFQPAYVPIFAQHPVKSAALEWLYVKAASLGTKVSADDYRHNQAELIAKWISQHVGKLTLSTGEKLTYKDIALLTRVGTNTRIYTDALRRYGISFQTETDKDFFHKQEINDLLLVLQVIADPEDAIAWAGVLRSPFGGLTDEELYQLSKKGPFSLEFLRTQELALPCVQAIEPFIQMAGRVSVQELVEKIIASTFLPELCVACYDGQRSLSYLQQFLGLVAEYEAQQNASLISLLADLKTRFTRPEQFVLPSADESADTVSLLTVHKSKGLEFPVVILADLSRKETVLSAHPQQHLFSWQHTMYGLRVGKICDVNLAFLEEEQKKHSRCEEVRILYVALTRAKEKLILVSDGHNEKNQTTDPFAAVGLLPDGMLGQVSAGGAMYQEALQHAAKQTPSSLEETKVLSESQTQGAQLGTVCHTALELLLTQEQTDVVTACRQSAQRHKTAVLAEQAVQVVEPFVKSALYAQLLQNRLLAAEMPYVVPLGDGTVQTGIMDSVFETKDNHIWIVDYKTDHVQHGQEKALFEQKYRSQLQAYRQAAEQLFVGKTVRVSALFVRTFAVVDL